MHKKAIIIILDGVGIGETPDSNKYGDEGSNSLKNTAIARNGLNLPNMMRIGLGNVDHIPGVPPVVSAIGSYGKMQEKSAGKDSTTGHWEIMGIILKQPFPTYPQGFPLEIIEQFEKLIGTRTLGNVVASGTKIIEQLGEEHERTGYPIVYTSADSVFQVAAHEKVITVDKLYEMCRKARKMLTGENAVGRVIARPFIGTPGNYTRTSNRHDFSIEPDTNILDYILDSGQEVIGVGKIKDLFGGRGVNYSYPTKDNHEGIKKIIELAGKPFSGLLFANLIDFDQQYGHRNDVQGYAKALEEFDRALPAIIQTMQSSDLLIITADHGCDPTTPGTDHSREYVPLLVYSNGCRNNINLGIRESFADVGQTVAEFLGLNVPGLAGQSFYSAIRRY